MRWRACIYIPLEFGPQSFEHSIALLPAFGFSSLFQVHVKLCHLLHLRSTWKSVLSYLKMCGYQVFFIKIPSLAVTETTRLGTRALRRWAASCLIIWAKSCDRSFPLKQIHQVTVTPFHLVVNESVVVRIIACWSRSKCLHGVMVFGLETRLEEEIADACTRQGLRTFWAKSCRGIERMNLKEV